MKSSDESVAKYDSTTGKVTGIKEGTCTITATTADGLTATCTVTVTKENESISLNKSTLDLTTGNSETLIATTTPSAVNVKLELIGYFCCNCRFKWKSYSYRCRNNDNNGDNN